MAHTFGNLLTHVIISTKDRQPLQPLLTPDLRTDLLAYMGGIVRNIHGELIDSNARPDHVHCLASLPPALAVADALRVIKSNSSLLVDQTAHGAAFAWQAGYGAFSISQSNLPGVVNYIRNQEQHHRKICFSGGIHRLPEGTPDLRRRAVYPGVGSAALAGAAECCGCPCSPRLTPRAILYRHSGPERHKARIFIKAHQCQVPARQPVTLSRRLRVSVYHWRSCLPAAGICILAFRI
jgi:putative transposase